MSSLADDERNAFLTVRKLMELAGHEFSNDNKRNKTDRSRKLIGTWSIR